MATRNPVEVARALRALEAAAFHAVTVGATADEISARYLQGVEDGMASRESARSAAALLANYESGGHAAVA